MAESSNFPSLKGNRGLGIR